jgi:hypothetical protein
MIEIRADYPKACFCIPGAMIECGGKGASRPFRAVFGVLTGWDASGG